MGTTYAENAEWISEWLPSPVQPFLYLPTASNAGKPPLATPMWTTEPPRNLSDCMADTSDADAPVVVEGK